MAEDPAGANVTRTISLAATSIAIFTFTLIFLYPKYADSTINSLFFQATLAVMAVSTFSFVFATVHYYRSSLGRWIGEAERALHARRAERFWAFAYALMLLAPSLVLFSVGLVVVASLWLVLWLAYVGFMIRFFPGTQTPQQPT